MGIATVLRVVGASMAPQSQHSMPATGSREGGPSPAEVEALADSLAAEQQKASRHQQVLAERELYDRFTRGGADTRTAPAGESDSSCSDTTPAHELDMLASAAALGEAAPPPPQQQLPALASSSSAASEAAPPQQQPPALPPALAGGSAAASEAELQQQQPPALAGGSESALLQLVREQHAQIQQQNAMLQQQQSQLHHIMMHLAMHGAAGALTAPAHAAGSLAAASAGLYADMLPPIASEAATTGGGSGTADAGAPPPMIDCLPQALGKLGSVKKVRGSICVGGA